MLERYLEKWELMFQKTHLFIKEYENSVTNTFNTFIPNINYLNKEPKKKKKTFNKRKVKSFWFFKL